MIFAENHNTHQIGIPQQNLRKVNLRDAFVTLGKLAKFQFQNFGLEVLHEVVEPVVLQILITFLAEKVNLQRGVDLVLPL